jgi:hypothetical protein
MAYIFQTLAKQASLNGIDVSKNILDARGWFRDVAQNVTSVNVNRLQSDQPFRLESSINARSIGRMYSFFYDAKGKATLPYWDRYPLIFPIEIYGDGFLGINLHYLPPLLRARLMDSLYSLVNNNKGDETTRLIASYKILKGSSRFKLFEPCVKRYLNSQVRSKFMYISPKEWDMALMLPTERFVGSPKSTAHGASSKMVGR